MILYTILKIIRRIYEDLEIWIGFSIKFRKLIFGKLNLPKIWNCVLRLMSKEVAMHDQRFLLAYPIGLIYAAFALITVF